MINLLPRATTHGSPRRVLRIGSSALCLKAERVSEPGSPEWKGVFNSQSVTQQVDALTIALLTLQLISPAEAAKFRRRDQLSGNACPPALVNSLRQCGNRLTAIPRFCAM